MKVAKEGSAILNDQVAFACAYHAVYAASILQTRTCVAEVRVRSRAVSRSSRQVLFFDHPERLGHEQGMTMHPTPLPLSLFKAWGNRFPTVVQISHGYWHQDRA
eukprot:TRINITY_DN3007_c0_g1_i3.p7 TRINITY_DN3007_c0_g1~~TRINITY_DN3007_c0_g1_i3.p7  ORF type:complete len:104 (-),score=3.84 TRINITY_DN3007_c0_g1_i3:345-656(-)